VKYLVVLYSLIGVGAILSPVQAEENIEVEEAQRFLEEVAQLEKRIETIHVRLEERWRMVNAGGAPIEPNRRGQNVFTGMWARDANGNIAQERIQKKSWIPEMPLAQMRNSYRVRKDGHLYLHDRRNSGLGDGQIMSVARSGRQELAPMQYVLPWTWWSRSKSWADPEHGADFRWSEVTRDGRSLRRVTWVPCLGATLSMLIDMEKGLLPIAIERVGPGKTYISIKVLETKQVADGIWLPTLVEKRQHESRLPSEKADRIVFRVQIDPVAVNQPLSEKLFEITWKPGTLVYDRDKKVQFHVIDESTLSATTRPSELQEVVGILLSAKAQRDDHNTKAGGCPAEDDDRAEDTGPKQSSGIKDLPAADASGP
jgi:hypothetical protein